LVVALPAPQGVPSDGHIYECQLRIVGNVNHRADPGTWHMFLGWRYAPFDNTPKPSPSRWSSLTAGFTNSVNVLSALPTFAVSTFFGRNEETEIEKQVAAIVELEEIEAMAIVKEEEGLEEESDVIELMVSSVLLHLAHCS
jgi:hypothetical protein